LFDVFLTCAHYVAHDVETHLCCCVVDTEVLSEVLGVGGLNWGMGGGLGVIWIVGVSLDGRRGVYWGNRVDGDCVSGRRRDTWMMKRGRRGWGDVLVVWVAVHRVCRFGDVSTNGKGRAGRPQITGEI
jgi:hypothetical protein